MWKMATIDASFLVSMISLFLVLTNSSCHAFSATAPPSINALISSSVKDHVREAQKRAEQAARDVHDNGVMNALFVNIEECPEPLKCKVASGKLPSDMPRGAFLRIGPNGGGVEGGWLDGDGMVHAIVIGDDDTITHSATYVDTQGRKREREVTNNTKKYSGTLGAAPQGLPMLGALLRNGLTFKTLDVQKDTCNTALACSGDRVLALMEQAPPSEIKVMKDGSLSTVESMARLGGAVIPAPINGGSFGAHGRTCPDDKERIHVSYTSTARPYVRVDYFGDNWELKKSVGVDVPSPVMIHDCALTENYVVIMDFPLTIRPSRMFLSNSFPVEYEPKNGARIGLVPRSATTGGETLWFDVDSGVVLHAANAYEDEDGRVVLLGLKSLPEGASSYILDYTPAFLHEWILDPSSGEVASERCLNPDTCVEFPAVEERLVGKNSEHVYSLCSTSIGGPMFEFKTPEAGVLLDSVIQFAVRDSEDGQVTKGTVVGRYDLPEGWHCVSEPTIVTKTIGEGCYCLVATTYVPPKIADDRELGEHVQVATDGKSMKTQLHILEGADISNGPVTVIDLPESRHINYGLHCLYLPWDKLI
mmetsp:Transcript_13422/g.20401  ORF Transcript_13422/g.20401 Transcript_13422/m.20401 type:complete len:590 (+) Transcript_13422:283-2052(+)|eukprot:CAMPEP_0196822794 /NCGR_PEP_ID=MMETSP1362-20130617/84842_1 /TAXON_ID=163516 /ORGANISM="Leptocylindrus danicus, Strain CCMP1856" /LENGTH=589 /DNA_ID=CAMNT_0042202451 /DNA_START=280 /DNA_END=2049 /DNA_ORIENTATION=-